MAAKNKMEEWSSRLSTAAPDKTEEWSSRLSRTSGGGTGAQKLSYTQKDEIPVDFKPSDVYRSVTHYLGQKDTTNAYGYAKRYWDYLPNDWRDQINAAFAKATGQEYSMAPTQRQLYEQEAEELTKTMEENGGGYTRGGYVSPEWRRWQEITGILAKPQGNGLWKRVYDKDVEMWYTPDNLQAQVDTQRAEDAKKRPGEPEKASTFGGSEAAAQGRMAESNKVAGDIAGMRGADAIIDGDRAFLTAEKELEQYDAAAKTAYEAYLADPTPQTWEAYEQAEKAYNNHIIQTNNAQKGYQRQAGELFATQAASYGMANELWNRKAETEEAWIEGLPHEAKLAEEAAETAAIELDYYVKGYTPEGYEFRYGSMAEAQAAIDYWNGLQQTAKELLQEHTYNAWGRTYASVMDNPKATQWATEGEDLQLRYDTAAKELEYYTTIPAPAGYTFRYGSAEEAQAELDYIRTEYGDLRASVEERYRYMSDEEEQIYYALLGSGNIQMAKGYDEWLRDTLNHRQGKAEADKILAMGGAERVLNGVFSSLDAGTRNALLGFGGLFGDEQATDSSAYRQQYLSQGTEGLEHYVYGAAQTVGNMLPSLVLGYAGGAVGATAMGLSVAGNARQEALREGWSEGQATTYGVLVGLFEGGLQYLLGGLSNLGGVADDVLLAKAAMLDSTAARLAATGAIKIGSEILEEELQEFIEPALASIIFGIDYDAPNAEQLLETAIVTALSTGFLEGGNIISTEQYNKTVNDLVRLGENSREGSNAYKMAAQVKAMLAEGETVEGSLLQRLQGAVMQEAGNEAAGVLFESGAEELTQAALDTNPHGEAYQLGLAMQEKLARGEDISDAEMGQLLRAYAEAKRQEQSMVTEVLREQKTAGSNAETTGINTNPAKHTAAEQAVIEQYQAAVDKDLVAFYENATGEQKESYALNPVSERAVADIVKITGVDVAGYKTTFDARQAAHIKKGHGPNGKTDQSMADSNDIGRIQYVLDNYDAVEDGGTTTAYWETKGNGHNRKAKTVVFSKKVNGTYYVVEAAPVSKAKSLYIVSAYMQKNGTQQRLSDAKAPQFTSKTSNVDSVPPVTSIPSSNGNSNRNFGETKNADVQAVASTLGANGSKMLMKAYETVKGSVDAKTAAGYFREVYNAALKNENLDAVKKLAEGKIPSAMIELAEQAGKNDALRALTAKHWGEEAGLKQDKNFRKSRINSKQARILDAVGKALGVKIVIDPSIRVKGKSAAGLYVDADGTIHLAADTANPVEAVFNHEIIHRLREASPEAYMELATFVMENADRSTLLGLRLLESKKDKELDADGAYEEVIANAFGRLMADKALLEQFAAQCPESAHKIRDAIRDIVVKIREFLHGAADMSQHNAELAAYKELGLDLEAMEKKLSKALNKAQADAKRNREKTAGMTRTVAKDGTVTLTDATGKVVAETKTTAGVSGGKAMISPTLESELDAVLNGTFDSSRNEVYVGTTSNFLVTEIGVKQLPVYMSAKKAYAAMVSKETAQKEKRYKNDKKLNYHNLGKKRLVQILQASEDPIAAFADTTDENGEKRWDRIVLVTDQMIDGEAAVVVEEVDSEALHGGKRLVANKTITAFPRGQAAEDIILAAQQGRLLFLDKKRSHAITEGVPGANSLTAVRDADFDISIRRFWDNVNWKKLGVTQMSFGSSGGQTAMQAALAKAMAEKSAKEGKTSIQLTEAEATEQAEFMKEWKRRTKEMTPAEIANLTIDDANAVYDGLKIKKTEKHGDKKQTMKRITEAEAIRAVYDALEHGDAGHDNLIALGQIPAILETISGLEGDLYVYRNHLYQNMVSTAEAVEEGRYDPNGHYHELGEETMQRALEALNAPSIVIADRMKDGNPAMTIVLPVFDKNDWPIHAVVSFYDKVSINGRHEKRPHIAVTFYGHDYEASDGRKGITDIVRDAIDSNRILYLDKKMRAEVPVIAKRAPLGNVTTTALKKNIAQFQKEIKDFKAKNKIRYSLQLTEAEATEQAEFMKEWKRKTKEMTPAEIANLTIDDANAVYDGLKIKKTEKHGDKESSFYGSVQDSDNVLFQTRELAETAEDIRYYQGISNEETLEKANEALNIRGRNESERFLALKKDEATAQDVALGFILLKRYQDAGQYEGAVRIIQKLREIGTAAGQTVQTFSLLGRMTPEGMACYAQTELDKARERMVKKKGEEWAEKRKEMFLLTEEELRFIRENIEKASRLPEGRDKNILLAEISSMLQNKMPTNVGRMLKGLARESMLLNPKTLVRNVAGNALMMPAYVVQDFVGSGIDRAMAKQSGVRTTGTTLPNKAALAAAKKGIYESYDDWRRHVNTKNVSGDRFEIGQGPAFTHYSKEQRGQANLLKRSGMWASNVFHGLDRVMGFLLETGDRPFFEYHFINALNNQLRLNGVEEATEEMVQIATTEALSRTWQDDNKVTKAAQVIVRVFNGGGEYGFGSVLVPFVKTPANLTKALIEYSPAALVTVVARKAVLYNRSRKSQHFDPKTQKAFVDSLSKAITGTLVMVIGGLLAAAGAITGGDDDKDKDLKDFEKNVMGIAPYSVVVDGKSYTYDWAQPVGSLTAITADVVQAVKSGDGMDLTEDVLPAAGNIILEALKTGGNVLYEQSFLQGISDLFSEDDLMSGLIDAVFGWPTQFVATALSQIAQMADPYARTTYEYKKTLHTTKNKVMAKIPGLRNKLANVVDVLGHDVLSYGGENNIWNVFFNPTNIYAETATAAAKEIYRVYGETGETTVIPRKASYYVEHEKQRYNFTSYERADVQRVMGQTTEKAVNDLLKNAGYASLSDEEKAKVLTKLNEYAGQVGKKTYLKERKVSYEMSDSWMEDALDAKDKYGIPVGVYVLLHCQTTGVKGIPGKNGKSIDNSASLQKMQIVYDTPGLTEKQRNALFEYLGVGEKIRHWNRARVNDELAKMRKKAG